MMQAEIQGLFEDFDLAADPILDKVIAEIVGENAALLASGLAMRLVQWCLADKVSEDEAKVIATSLVTELTTLAANIKAGTADGDRTHERRGGAFAPGPRLAGGQVSAQTGSETAKRPLGSHSAAFVRNLGLSDDEVKLSSGKRMTARGEGDFRAGMVFVRSIHRPRADYPGGTGRTGQTETTGLTFEAEAQRIGASNSENKRLGP